MIKTLRVICVGVMMTIMAPLSAQNVNEVVDSVKAGLKAHSVKDAVNSMKGAFKAKVASADSLIGTWTYVEPAVLATSGGLLIKAVGSVAEKELEKLLKTYSDKSGITPKNTSFTFRKNGTFQRVVAGRKAEGVWMVNDDHLLLALHNVQTADLTTHLENGELMLLVEGKKIINFYQKLGGLKDNTATKAIEKVLKVADGIEGGLMLVKKH